MNIERLHAFMKEAEKQDPYYAKAFPAQLFGEDRTVVADDSCLFLLNGRYPDLPYDDEGFIYIDIPSLVSPVRSLMGFENKARFTLNINSEILEKYLKTHPDDPQYALHQKLNLKSHGEDKGVSSIYFDAQKLLTILGVIDTIQPSIFAFNYQGPIIVTSNNEFDHCDCAFLSPLLENEPDIPPSEQKKEQL